MEIIKKNKNLVIVGLAVLIAVVGFVALSSKPASAQLSDQPNLWEALMFKWASQELDVDVLAEPSGDSLALGAVAGPDIPHPYLKWGGGFGVRVYPTAIALKTATTTICAIQAPAATSTLLSAGVKLDVSTTTASIVDLAKATTAFATTTKIGTTYNVAANAQAMINASTTPAAGDTTIFGPNEWFVVNMVGGAGLTVSPTGACHATFEEYPTF